MSLTQNQLFDDLQRHNQQLHKLVHESEITMGLIKGSTKILNDVNDKLQDLVKNRVKHMNTEGASANVKHQLEIESAVKLRIKMQGTIRLYEARYKNQIQYVRDWQVEVDKAQKIYDDCKKLDAHLSDGSVVLSPQTLVFIFAFFWYPCDLENIRAAKKFRSVNVAFREATYIYLRENPCFYPTLTKKYDCKSVCTATHFTTESGYTQLIIDGYTKSHDINEYLFNDEDKDNRYVYKRHGWVYDADMDKYAFVPIVGDRRQFGILIMNVRGEITRLGGNMDIESPLNWHVLPTTKVTIVDETGDEPGTSMRVIRSQILIRHFDTDEISVVYTKSGSKQTLLECELDGSILYLRRNLYI